MSHFREFMESTNKYLVYNLSKKIPSQNKKINWKILPIILSEIELIPNEYTKEFLEYWGEKRVFYANVKKDDTLFANVRLQTWSSFNTEDCNDPNSLYRLIEDIVCSEDIFEQNNFEISPYMIMLYTVFWNILFVCIASTSHKKNFSTVAELAFHFGMTNEIFTDLCQGASYLLSGKKLHYNVSLKCSSPYCRRFFGELQDDISQMSVMYFDKKRTGKRITRRMWTLFQE